MKSHDELSRLSKIEKMNFVAFWKSKKMISNIYRSKSKSSELLLFLETEKWRSPIFAWILTIMNRVPNIASSVRE